METDEEYLKRIRKRAARKLQKETGDKYTTCLRAVIAAEGGEVDGSGVDAPSDQGSS